MIFQTLSKPTPLREAIISAYRKDETQAIFDLLTSLEHYYDPKIKETARELVIGIRDYRSKQGGLDSFLHQYDLSSDEGIALMCLAEALLRIPDKDTVDKLISDKISTAEWQNHIKRGNSLFVNAATWSLMLTGKIFSPHLNYEQTFGNAFSKLTSRLGGAVIRPIVMQGMKLIGKQFVMGGTIEEALKRAKSCEAMGYRYSYDMLGEAAKTAEDAEFYFNSYVHAIQTIGASLTNANPIQSPGISVKLSALHPRYEFSKKERVMEQLPPLLLSLAQLAKEQNIGLTVDAEEADRLDISLDIIEAVFKDPSLIGWEGFGLAVQSYQKRAPYVLDWLADLSKRYNKRLMVRLVKGAYWDYEIKMSQLLGLENYPVFTRKNATDVSFLACAKKMLANSKYFYPQFGTHNAYSVAAILQMAGDYKDFEFQCLHGMGAPLYDQIVGKKVNCRVYAPVGHHKDLLAYLVRRLLENGANTSFINQIADTNIDIEQLISDPVAKIAALNSKPHPRIPLPLDLYRDRKNSSGIDLSNPCEIYDLKESTERALKNKWESASIIGGKMIKQGDAKIIYSPADLNRVVGKAYKATEEDVDRALALALEAQTSWELAGVDKRATILEKIADLLQENMSTLVSLLSLEAGKHIPDCISEIRETIDYCRYYAMRARIDMRPHELHGPTGEFNQLTLHPRGLIVCISPWNFPLAIFSGQVLAALVTGNCVIAKPAEQTTLIATYAVQLMHQAGIPVNVLQLIQGRGSVIGARLTADPRIAGVMLTGSTETAKLIQQTLSNKKGPIVPLIAETGGQNAMIVDSSALPEQVITDVITSAFNSAGQRCSALRVLFIQEDVAPKMINMLKGAMAEIKLGDPTLLDTDVGPVIDPSALKGLEEHCERMLREGKLIHQVEKDDQLNGHFFAPCAFEIDHLSILQGEVFGPILHVIRYASKDLDKVMQSIVDTGYGLTMGIHSRIDSRIDFIVDRMPVGNIYVNRNMVGAVVGVQPFGGQRLSGTGPKAGGPHYLPALCYERTLSVNTTASGGNASLVSLMEG